MILALQKLQKKFYYGFFRLAPLAVPPAAPLPPRRAPRRRARRFLLVLQVAYAVLTSSFLERRRRYGLMVYLHLTTSLRYVDLVPLVGDHQLANVKIINSSQTRAAASGSSLLGNRIPLCESEAML